MNTRIGTAVVLGGSLSGMVAAAVLSRHAKRVVVIERDALGTGTFRKGVPQARHNHNLAPKGLEILERLYPGLTADAAAEGASVADIGSAGRWIFRGAPLARVEVGAKGLFATRPLLETLVEARVRALANVELRDRTDVLGLVVDAEGARTTGVRILARDHERADEVLSADLVVDASGRGSRIPAWLASAGQPAPRTDEVEVRVTYATRAFRRSPNDRDRYVFVTGAAPQLARGGVAFAVDGDRWLVLLFGYGGEKPPLDDDGFLAYARSLAAPDLAELILRLEPLDERATYSFPRATRRRYDEIARPLRGLLVIGDALSSTNPSYGLGMTSLALQSEVLDECLRRGIDEHRYFTRALRACADIWELTTGNDSAYDCVPIPDETPRLLRRYFARLYDVAADDPTVSRALLRVAMRIAPRASVLHPRIALRVLLPRRRAEARSQPLAPEARRS
jgi:2-polyprenyl-6-methoxyphenol hydroxylase-like FAD-dependent oxidoreductase